MRKKKQKAKKKPAKKAQPKFVNVNKNLNVVHINSNLNPRRKRKKRAPASNVGLIQNLNLQNQLKYSENMCIMVQAYHQKAYKEFSLNRRLKLFNAIYLKR